MTCNVMNIKNLSAEESVLGALMLEQSLPKHQSVFAILDAQDFSTPDHAELYRTIKVLSEQGIPTDVVTVSDKAEVDLAWVGLLAKDTPSAHNIEHYAKLVKDYSTRRQMSAELNKCLQQIYDKSLSLEEISSFLSSFGQSVRLNTSRPRLTFTSVAELKIRPAEWIVEDYLLANSLVTIFGPPESGKSLLALDIGLCLAANIPWNGKQVEPGKIFYVCGEGHPGVSKRIRAWCIDHNVDQKTLASTFFVSNMAASFCDEKSVLEVIHEIKQILAKSPSELRLIIIDTLARNFGAGNENSTEDMTHFVNNLDRLRNEFNVAILVVHHTGHGSPDRGRGSSVLKAAVDTEFSMKANRNVITLDCTKMKDASHPQQSTFSLEEIDLGLVDKYQKPITSAILKPTGYQGVTLKPQRMGKNQQLALDTLKEMFFEHRAEKESRGQNPDDAKVTVSLWKKRTELQNNRFDEAKRGLLDNGLICLDGCFVELLSI